MPIDQASYRGWEGVARPGRRAALAIAGTMIRRMRRGLLVRMFIYWVPIIIIALSVMIFSFAYVLEQSPIKMAIERRGFDLADVNLLAYYNRLVQERTGMVALILAALVGAPLIAEDRRARALSLYFSRPITHFDYVLGKFLTVACFLGALLLAPPILTYVVEIALSPKENVAASQLPTVLRALVPAGARLVALSAIALGVSALTRKTNYASLLTFAVGVFALALAQIFAREVFENPEWFMLSPLTCADRLVIEYMPVEPQFDRTGLMMRQFGLDAAWLGLGIWTAAGFAVLTLKIRKVEVVQ